MPVFGGDEHLLFLLSWSMPPQSELEEGLREAELSSCRYVELCVLVVLGKGQEYSCLHVIPLNIATGWKMEEPSWALGRTHLLSRL